MRMVDIKLKDLGVDDVIEGDEGEGKRWKFGFWKVDGRKKMRGLNERGNKRIVIKEKGGNRKIFENKMGNVGIEDWEGIEENKEGEEKEKIEIEWRKKVVKGRVGIESIDEVKELEKEKKKVMEKDGLEEEIEDDEREIGKLKREMEKKRNEKDGNVEGGRMMGNVRKEGRIEEGSVENKKEERNWGNNMGEKLLREEKILKEWRRKVVWGFSNNRKGRILRKNRMEGKKEDISGRKGGGIGRKGNESIIVDEEGVDGLKKNIESNNIGKRRRIEMWIGIWREKSIEGVRIKEDRGIYVVEFRNGRWNGGKSGVKSKGC